MPDLDFHCAPAPAPVPASPEAANKTMTIDRGGTSKTGLIVIGLIIALVGGAAFTAMRNSNGAASASAEVVTGESSPDAVKAEAAGDVPAECAGDVADPQLRWYCTEFLPFAKKAAADHGRIDRLEAAGGGSGAPLGLWVLVIGIGILTVVNTLMILSKTRSKPNG